MNPPIALDQEILTLKDVCELLQVYQSTVYKLVKEGKIPAFRIGSDWRFRTDLMMRWMDEHSLPSREFDIDPQTPVDLSASRSLKPPLLAASGRSLSAQRLARSRGCRKLWESSFIMGMEVIRGDSVKTASSRSIKKLISTSS